MTSLKKRIDKIFIVVSVILTIVSFFIPQYPLLGLLFLIGFLIASITLGKDIKRIESNNFSGQAFNLVVNLGLYALAFLIGGLVLQIVGIVAIGVGLITYRQAYFSSLTRVLKKEGELQ